MKKPLTLDQFIKIIIDEWQLPGRDISDIGNIIGIKLAEKDLEEASSFLSGVKHGISLVDGNHFKNNEMRAKTIILCDIESTNYVCDGLKCDYHPRGSCRCVNWCMKNLDANVEEE